MADDEKRAAIRRRFTRWDHFDNDAPAPTPPTTRRLPSWVPERIDGETDVDYWGRYGVAEFRAMLDGDLKPGRSTRIDMFGQAQWADPAGGRFG
jgi:hypothetical protein